MRIHSPIIEFLLVLAIVGLSGLLSSAWSSETPRTELPPAIGTTLETKGIEGVPAVPPSPVKPQDLQVGMERSADSSADEGSLSTSPTQLKPFVGPTQADADNARESDERSSMSF